MAVIYLVSIRHASGQRELIKVHADTSDEARQEVAEQYPNAEVTGFWINN